MGVSVGNGFACEFMCEVPTYSRPHHSLGMGSSLISYEQKKIDE